ncbi:hypothetical protein MBLNU230_g7521t1 [Neophaeotheca triangularis]
MEPLSINTQRLRELADLASHERTSKRDSTTPPFYTGHEFDDFDWAWDSQKPIDDQLGHHTTNGDGEISKEDGEDSSVDGSVHVDTDHDEVYLKNPGPGSYTKIMEDDGPLPACVAEMLQKIRLREEQGSSAPEYSGWCCQPKRSKGPGSDVDEDEEHHLEKYDQGLRSVMREIKQGIRRGDPLVLEFSGREGSVCGFPDFRSKSHRIPAGCYYVTIGTVEGQSKFARMFCLRCLEIIWNGQGMIGEVPSPSPTITDHQAIPGEVEKLTEGIPSISGIDGAADSAEEQSDEGGDGPDGKDELGYWFRDEVLASAAKCGEHRKASGTDTGISQDTDISSRAKESLTDTSSSDSSSIARMSKRKATIHPTSALAPLGGLSPQGLLAFNGVQNVQSTSAQPLGGGKIRVEPSVSPTHPEPRRSIRLKSSNAMASPKVDKDADPLAIDPTQKLDRKKATTDNYAAKVAKTEAKVSNMNTKRNELLKSLEPGQKVPVKNLRNAAGKTVNTLFRPHVSKDVFGVPYTDLLEEPPTPGFHQSALQEFPPPSNLSTMSPTLQYGEIPSNMRQSAAKSPLLPSSCSCHQPDSGEMVQCSNETCTCGWYHVSCVKQENPKQEGWLCSLCKPETKTKSGPSATMKALADEIFKPPYAGKSVYGFDQPMSDWFKPAIGSEKEVQGSPVQQTQPKRNDSSFDMPLNSPKYLPSQLLQSWSADGKQTSAKQASVKGNSNKPETVQQTAKDNDGAKGVTGTQQKLNEPLEVIAVGSGDEQGSVRDSMLEFGKSTSPADEGVVAGTDLASDDGLAAPNSNPFTMQLDGAFDEPSPVKKSSTTLRPISRTLQQLDGPDDSVPQDAPITESTRCSELSAYAETFIPNPKPYETYQPQPQLASQYHNYEPLYPAYAPPAFAPSYAQPAFASAYTLAPRPSYPYAGTWSTTPRFTPTMAAPAPVSRLRAAFIPPTRSTRQRTTRFQHLSRFMKPGSTLNAQDKAVLALWKVQTQEMGWEGEKGYWVKKAGLEGAEWEGKDLLELLEMVKGEV